MLFHPDGNLMPILEGLIEAGTDLLHSLEPLAGINPGKIHRLYPDRRIEKACRFVVTCKAELGVRFQTRVKCPGTPGLKAAVSSSMLLDKNPMWKIKRNPHEYC